MLFCIYLMSGVLLYFPKHMECKGQFKISKNKDKDKDSDKWNRDRVFYQNQGSLGDPYNRYSQGTKNF